MPLIQYRQNGLQRTLLCSCTLIGQAHDVNDFSRIFPDLRKIFWRKVPATAGGIRSIVAVRLFFSIRMMKAVIFFRTHGTLHFVRHCRTMTVLEGPHTLRVKKGHTVAVMQDVT